MIVAVLVAGLAGWLDADPVVRRAADGAAFHPGMTGVHLYQEFGDGTSLRLEAASIAPAPGEVGPLLSWLKPILAVARARVIIHGTRGARVIVTGRRCRLSKDGRTIIFEHRVRWYRCDQDRLYACRRVRLDLDTESATFQDTVRLLASERSVWGPFVLSHLLAPFPSPDRGEMQSRRLFPSGSSSTLAIHRNAPPERRVEGLHHFQGRKS